MVLLSTCQRRQTALIFHDCVNLSSLIQRPLSVSLKRQPRRHRSLAQRAHLSTPAPAAPPDGTPISVFLVRSDHFGWYALRQMLHDHPRVSIVGETTDLPQAASAIAALRPTIIFVPETMQGVPVPSFVSGLSAGSLGSKIIMMAEDLPSDTPRTLGRLGIKGYLVWADLSPMMVQHCLSAVADAALWVASASASQRIVAGIDSQSHLQGSDSAVSGEEHVVLRGLADGLTQREIAGELHLSVPSVERIIAVLRARFGVATTNALCVQIGRLRLLD